MQIPMNFTMLKELHTQQQRMWFQLFVSRFRPFSFEINVWYVQFRPCAGLGSSFCQILKCFFLGHSSKDGGGGIEISERWDVRKSTPTSLLVFYTFTWEGGQRSSLVGNASQSSPTLRSRPWLLLKVPPYFHGIHFSKLKLSSTK